MAPKNPFLPDWMNFEDPFERVRKQYESILKPMRDYEQMLEPYRAQQELIAGLIGSKTLANYNATLEAALGSTTARMLAEGSRSVLEAAGLTSGTNALLDTYNKQAEFSRSVISQFLPSTAAASMLTGRDTGWLHDTFTALTALAAATPNVLDADFDDDDTDTESIASVQRVVRDLAASPSAARSETVVSAVNSAPPSVRRRAILILLAVIARLLQVAAEGEWQFYVGEVMKPVRKHVVRKIEGVLRVSPPPVGDAKQALRLLTATDVNVRLHPRRSDSRIVGQVSFPDLVIVLDERGDWIKVRLEDGDAVIEGWIFKRYAKKVPSASSAGVPVGGD